MDTPAPERTLETVAKRRDVLAAVADGAGDVRDLRDALDLSRSTVYEATRELGNAGLIARADQGFELTPFGRSAVAIYDRCLAALETLCEAQPALDAVRDDVALSPVLRGETEVVRAAPHAPDRPFEATAAFFDDATRVWGFAPVTGARYVDGLDEAARTDGVVVDMVTVEPVVSYLVANHPETLERWVRSDEMRLYETDETLSYGLLVATEPSPRLGVLLYDDAGQFRALLRSEDRGVVDWGHAEVEARMAHATELAEVAADGAD